MTTRQNLWRGRAAVVTAVTSALTLTLGGVALADNIQDSIEDGGTAVTLVAGSSTSGTATIRLVGNNSGGDPDPGCNIDTGETPLNLDVLTPAGVTANPDPLSITTCGIDYTVNFTASSSAVSGTASVSVVSGPAGGGTYFNQVSIPITVTQPAPANTKPSVEVAGVTDGAAYVIGAVPTAMCDVTDAQQPDVADFAAALGGTLTDGLGSQTATCDWTDAQGLSADTASVTYTIVPPPNTPPVVEVTGVEDGGAYEIGDEPTPMCAVTDAEDGASTIEPVVTGTLSHGLGTLTARCDYTDLGGLEAETRSLTYSIVDTGKPTITASVSSAPNTNGWYKDDVTVTFQCDDTGSGVQSCLADGETGPSRTVGQGEDQSVSGTATDWAGNTETATKSGIYVDKTAPTVSLVGGPTGSYYYGDDPVAPTCAASDALSGLVGACEVTGGGTSVGTHSYTVTVYDKAGNEARDTLSYTVLAWELKGFFSPVDMSGVWNTVKGGSTVPLKFEIFNGTRELTDTAKVKSFSTKSVTCPGASASADEIEFTTTGGTALRYDTTAGQFIQNWQTLKKPGTCHVVTMTTQDGSTISANFILK